MLVAPGFRARVDPPTTSSWSPCSPDPRRLSVRASIPITLEIIRGSLASTIRDMELLMERCAMSPFIKEKKDYFVGIFDTRGRIVACHISGSGPGHAGGRSCARTRSRPCGRATSTGSTTRTSPTAPSSTTRTWCSWCRCSTTGRLVAFTTTFGHYQDIGGLAGRQHLAARDRDLPRGRARAARAHRARGPAQRGGVPDLPPQLAAARHGRGRHARDDGLLPPRRDAAGRAVRALRGRHRARRVRRVHRADGRAGARAVPRAGARRASGRFHDLPRQRRRHRRAAVSRRSDADARAATRGHARRLERRTTRRAGPINFTTNPGPAAHRLRPLSPVARARPRRERGPAPQPRRVDRARGQPAQAALPRAARHARQHALPRDVLHLRRARPGQRRPRARGLARLRALLLPRPGTRRASGRSSASRASASASARARSRTASTSSTTSPRRTTRSSTSSATSRSAWSATRCARTPAAPAMHRGGTGVVRDVRVLCERAELATRMENTLVAPYGVAGGRAGRTGRITLNPGTPEERELPAPGRRHRAQARRPAALRDVRRRRLGRSAHPRSRCACARTWRAASSPRAARSRTTASCSTPRRWRSTRPRPTRSAPGAPATCRSSIAAPASRRRRHAGVIGQRSNRSPDRFRVP